MLITIINVIILPPSFHLFYFTYHIHSYILSYITFLFKHFSLLHHIQYYTEGGDILYKEAFAARLAELRNRNGASAREMSLSIGQNAGYINNIECGKSLPSMASFFYICEYLHISPTDFFDVDVKNPEELRTIINNLKKLDRDESESVALLVDHLAKKNHTCKKY